MWLCFMLKQSCDTGILLLTFPFSRNVQKHKDEITEDTEKIDERESFIPSVAATESLPLVT